MADANPGLRPGLSSAVPVRQARGRLYGTRLRDGRSHAPSSALIRATQSGLAEASPFVQTVGHPEFVAGDTATARKHRRKRQPEISL
jgi:hypothetical protein